MKLYNGMFLMLSSLALFADESNIPPEVETFNPHELAYGSSQMKKVQAQDKAEKTHCHKPDNNRIQVGGNYSYAWIKPKGSHRTKGNMGGARALYEYRPQDSVYTGVAFSWRMGTTKNSSTHRKLQDYNGQERIGYTFGKKRIGDNALTLFTGAGVRYLGETVSASSASLKMDYTEFYVPVGFLFENRVNSIFTWGCNFQWMPQVYTTVRLSPLSGAQWGLKRKLNNFFVEVPFTMSLCTERYVLIVSPFFENWHDGRSTAKTTTGLALGLPGNSYLFTGVNVSFGVTF